VGFGGHVVLQSQKRLYVFKGSLHWAGFVMQTPPKRKDSKSRVGLKPQGFSKRDTDKHRRGLASGRRWVAQSARQKIADNVAHANSRAAHACTGQTRAYIGHTGFEYFCCFEFHEFSPYDGIL
jgi:hypothetical protein